MQYSASARHPPRSLCPPRSETQAERPVLARPWRRRTCWARGSAWTASQASCPPAAARNAASRVSWAILAST
eukprot:12675814-Alexandrium_andersonii.AAC.1